MEDSLVMLIAHLVYSGMDIETALERAREYMAGLRGFGLILLPSMAERIRNDGEAFANQAVLEATPKAWELVERWRKEGRMAYEEVERMYTHLETQ